MEDYMTRQKPARRRGSRAERAGLDTPSMYCVPVFAAPIQSCLLDIPRPRPKQRGGYFFVKVFLVGIEDTADVWLHTELMYSTGHISDTANTRADIPVCKEKYQE